ncbi:MAG TPA: hypothetical protein VGK02_06710 [Candidatus Aquicultor sp.]|jgi:hypothetical protein
MKNEVNQGALAAGVILIIAGIFALLINFGLLSGVSFLIALGVAFLVAFAIWRNLGFLIPGMILLWLGIGLTITEQSRLNIANDGSIIVAALGLAFISIYLLMPRRRHWWPLIPGGILLVIGITIFLFAQNIIPFTFIQVINVLWPAAIIILGIWLVLRQLYFRR